MNPKKTKFPAVLYTLAFFLACAFFSAGMLIPGAADAKDGGDLPKPVSEGKISESFGDDFENWFSKHFAFRDRLVDFFSTVKETVFRTGNDQVIVGREGFLFFADTLASYTGDSSMTDGELEEAADALARLAEYAGEHGAKFVFLCAPNKNTVYPEMMPASVPKNRGPSDLDRLYALLDDRGIPFCDLRPILEAGKKDRLIYHKRDSHWNAEGARLAAKAVTDFAGLGRADFLSVPLTETRRDFQGDLDALLYPEKTRYDFNPVFGAEGRFQYTTRYSTPMDMQIGTASEVGEGKITVFRDSFSNALIPFFASAFREAWFARAVPYRIDRLEGEPADLVIVEIAERNLRTLIGSDERIASGSGKGTANEP